MLGGWDLYQPKAQSRLPNNSQYKVSLCLPPFDRNSNVSNSNAIPPFRGYGGHMGVENGTIRDVVPTFLFEFLLTIGLSCAVWSQYTARQTGRQSKGSRAPYTLQHRRPKSKAPSRPTPTRRTKKDSYLLGGRHAAALRVVVPQLSFYKAWTCSPSRKLSRSVSMTELGQSVFELCEPERIRKEHKLWV